MAELDIGQHCQVEHCRQRDSKMGETANKRRKGAKNSETAAKVALMKLKMHANGDKTLPQMEFGVVYSCVEDKMYTGRKGKGAFCNGQKLQVSRQEDITKSLLVTEFGSSRTPETVRIILSNMEKLLCIPIHGIRGVGTAAVNMCLVATGGADAYYEMGIHCWDMAGAGIIVTEAGGVLMDVTGGPFDLMSRRIIAASSRTLAERIAKEIQIIPFQRDDED
ncbi:Inositol monophosphatase 1 [Tupaia chinensis]|uniref:Inositol monophosphatase 1 n=1 Tax=Tupaia chinensis TaxID=246437 RepID=L8Y2T5_TUPCH|nr:Inositol monophosphatase 1 [Tupaia chinensis]